MRMPRPRLRLPSPEAFLQESPQPQGDAGMAEAPDEATPWVTLSEAASLTGRHIDAVRSLVRRRKLPARKGNNGQWLVQVPASAPQSSVGRGAVGDAAITELLAEVAELREALAKAIAEAKAASDIAEARVDAANARGDAANARFDAANASAKALRELADQLTAELADARRSWLERLIAALRR